MSGTKTVEDTRPFSVTYTREGLLLLLPSALTLTRLFITYILCIQLITGRWGFPLFSLACLTDVLDGWAARRFRSETGLGSLFDASADFVLVSSTSAFLIWRNLTSPLFLGLIVLAFMRFILVKPGRGCDPLGKHIGTALFISLGMILMYPAPFLATWSTFVASSYVVVSMILSTAIMAMRH